MFSKNLYLYIVFSGKADFDQRDIIFTILVEFTFTMLHIKYLNSRPCGLRNLFSFHIYVKPKDRWGGVSFDTGPMILANLLEVN